MIKNFLLLFSVISILTSPVFSQIEDISGDWVYTFGPNYSKAYVEIEQNKNVLTGTLKDGYCSGIIKGVRDSNRITLIIAITECDGKPKEFPTQTEYSLILNSEGKLMDSITDEAVRDGKVVKLKGGKFQLRRITLKPPCDDEEVVTKYDKANRSYHTYTEENKICVMDNPLCSRRTVFAMMISKVRFITPTEDDSKVKDCMETDVDIPGPWGKDAVRISINKGSYKVTNFTKRSHILHPGQVVRTVIERDGAIYVKTFGEGTGNFKTENEKRAKSLWGDVDKGLTDAMQKSSLQTEPPNR